MAEWFDTLSKWELIKACGGISAIVSFIAILIRELFLSKWKTKQEIKVEKIRSELDKSNQLISNLTNTSTDLILSANQKKIECLDLLWSKMMSIRESFNKTVYTFYTILTKDEIIKLPTTAGSMIADFKDSFDFKKYLESISDLLSQAQRTRPFIGTKLWSIFFSYYAFQGRLTYLIFDGFETGQVRYWLDDAEKKTIYSIFNKVIDEEMFEKITKDELLAFNTILIYLESLALNEISEQLSGKEQINLTLDYVLELSERAKEIEENKKK